MKRTLSFDGTHGNTTRALDNTDTLLSTKKYVWMYVHIHTHIHATHIHITISPTLYTYELD